MITSKVKKLAISISISIIIGFLSMIPMYYVRIQNLGGLYLDTPLVVCSISWICFVSFVIFVIVFGFWSIGNSKLEGKKAINDFMVGLEDGERKVLYKYRRNNIESHILSQIVDSYNPIYSAKIKEDNTVDLIVRERETNKLICDPINVKDIEYLVSHFKFDEED
ncbi:MAG: hypothetical protein IJE05_05285 [Clostridia bacterium]|nr:hypothetical protein [Clostridia bacterium]